MVSPVASKVVGASRYCGRSRGILSWKLRPGRAGGLVRILVVDDNPAVRHYLRALLEQQSTWQVCDEARTGGEALQRVKKNPPDMILLDFQMPDLNGLGRRRADFRPLSGNPNFDGYDSFVEAAGRGSSAGRNPRSLREIGCGLDCRGRRCPFARRNLFPNNAFVEN